MKSGVRNFAAKAFDVLRLLLCLTPFLFVSCSHSSNDLSENKTFQKVFTASEINDLQRLFDFFNESICEGVNSNLDRCYELYLKQIREERDTVSGAFKINLSYDEQKSVYEQLTDSTFNQIWWFGKAFFFNPPDTMKYIYFNTQGKYLEFLKLMGEEDRVIKGYAEGVENSGGDIPPSLVAGVLMNYEYYNLSDIRVKFIVAVHYITLNDVMFRDEKYIDSD